MRYDRPWWWRYARCHGRTHIFISPGSNTPVCKRICESCDAMDVCFWFAVSREQSYDEGSPLRFGIFGGFSARERDEFVRRYSITQDVARREYDRAQQMLRHWVSDET